MKKKDLVVVAMSGGVDSSVAAALLQKQGYEVVGMTMCFNFADTTGRRPACCGLQGIEDARRVCHKLGIRHYVVNMRKTFDALVIKDFFEQYLQGRTPNPCVRCNQYIKFDALLKKALGLGAKYLATGHYARIRQGRVVDLCKAKDKKKDQSYFLYRLNQQQLKSVLFPLGSYTKIQIRAMARKFGLAVAEKLDSQEICFLPDNDYRGFLEKEMKEKLKPGPVVNQEGKVLGQHKGIAFYTVGQRGGLGIALGYPVYVSKIDAENNRIVIGTKDQAMASEFVVDDLSFTGAPLKKKVALKVRIRYNHKEEPAEVSSTKGKITVRFKKPQFAVTPGQSAVFFDKDKVVGGGIIERVVN